MTHVMPDCLDNVGDDDIVEGKFQWNMKCFDGSWIQNQNAGGCRNHLNTFVTNPQYLVRFENCDVSMDESCICIISLMQKRNTKETGSKSNRRRGRSNQQFPYNR
jgi:hypothetical protein